MKTREKTHKWPNLIVNISGGKNIFEVCQRLKLRLGVAGEIGPGSFDHWELSYGHLKLECPKGGYFSEILFWQVAKIS